MICAAPSRASVITSGWMPLVMRSHTAHTPQPSPGAASQLSADATARARSRLPAPRGPVKSSAWCRRPRAIAPRTIATARGWRTSDNVGTAPTYQNPASANTAGWRIRFAIASAAAELSPRPAARRFRSMSTTPPPVRPPEPPAITAFREVPRTGVIFVTTEAKKRGFDPSEPDWCNLGQGMPEAEALPGAPPRKGSIEIDLADQEYAPVAGIGELREAVASLYNKLFRRGMPSQYSADNVAISGATANAIDARFDAVTDVEKAAMMRRVDALIYLHRSLKMWLAPHVLTTSLMLALMVVHIIQVIYFAVR